MNGEPDTGARIEVLGILAEAVGPERAIELVHELVRDAEMDMALKCAPLSSWPLDKLAQMISYGGVKQ